MLTTAIHPMATKTKGKTDPSENPAGGAGHPKQGPADWTINQDEGKKRLWLSTLLQINLPQCLLYPS